MDLREHARRGSVPGVAGVAIPTLARGPSLKFVKPQPALAADDGAAIAVDRARLAGALVEAPVGRLDGAVLPLDAGPLVCIVGRRA